MNKKEFLEKLRRRLIVLDSVEIEDIIVEYGGYIDEKVKKGKTEDQAIKEFGNLDELVKEILSAYKINDDGTKVKNVVMNFFDDMGKTFERIASNLNDKEPDQIVKFVVEIVLLLILIGICRIPVELIIHLGKDIFIILPTPLYAVLYGLWRFLFELVYLVLSVLFFLKVFKDRFSKSEGNEELKTKSKSNKKDNVPAVKKESVKKVKAEPKESYNYYPSNDEGMNVAMIILKIFAAFFLIPTIGMLLGFVIAFALGVGLVISGVHYFGFLICLFAIMQFAILLVDILCKFIFGGKIRPFHTVGNLVFSIVAFGVGISIASFEIINTTYINSVPENYRINQITKEYNKYQIDYISSWGDIEYIVDESMSDNVLVKIEYYEDYIKPTARVWDNVLIIERDRINRLAPKETFKNIVDNLKNKEIYNYVELYRFNIKVYGTSSTINDLR